MKATIEITIPIEVEFEYEPAEPRSFHDPGWPVSAKWIDYDEFAVLVAIEAELDKIEEQLIEIVEQEKREMAGDAAYEEWKERRGVI
jgi:hypothetical protein